MKIYIAAANHSHAIMVAKWLEVQRFTYLHRYSQLVGFTPSESIVYIYDTTPMALVERIVEHSPRCIRVTEEMTKTPRNGTLSTTITKGS